MPCCCGLYPRKHGFLRAFAAARHRGRAACGLFCSRRFRRIFDAFAFQPLHFRIREEALLPDVSADARRPGIAFRPLWLLMAFASPSPRRKNGFCRFPAIRDLGPCPWPCACAQATARSTPQGPIPCASGIDVAASLGLDFCLRIVPLAFCLLPLRGRPGGVMQGCHGDGNGKGSAGRRGSASKNPKGMNGLGGPLRFVTQS